jgi:hypothetical protein
MSILYMREEKSNSLAVAGKQAETCCTVAEPSSAAGSWNAIFFFKNGLAQNAN